MFYDIFIELCKEKKVRPAKVARDLELNQSTVSMWKSQGTAPNAITLVQLAEYFGTTPAYLMGNKSARNPVQAGIKFIPTPKEEYQATYDTLMQELNVELERMSNALNRYESEETVDSAMKNVKSILSHLSELAVYGIRAQKEGIENLSSFNEVQYHKDSAHHAVDFFYQTLFKKTGNSDE